MHSFSYAYVTIKKNPWTSYDDESPEDFFEYMWSKSIHYCYVVDDKGESLDVFNI